MRPYAEVATEVMWPYVEGALTRDELATIVTEAYATFDRAARDALPRPASHALGE